MKKALRNEEDPYLALMSFRACPSPDGTPAPAVMLIESFRFDYDCEIFYSNLLMNHVIFLRHPVLTASES